MKIKATGTRKSVLTRRRTIRRAVGEKCLDCSGGLAREVTLCGVDECPLWEYRTGFHVSTSVYKDRMRKASISCCDDLASIKKDYPDCLLFKTIGKGA